LIEQEKVSQIYIIYVKCKVLWSIYSIDTNKEAQLINTKNKKRSSTQAYCDNQINGFAIWDPWWIGDNW
jgi:hypothetical protein